jgi:hypothetical protein
LAALNTSDEAAVNRLLLFAIVTVLSIGTTSCRRHRCALPRCLLRHAKPNKAAEHVKPAAPKPIAAVESPSPAPAEQSEAALSRYADYPWLKNTSTNRPKAAITLNQRFSEPPHFRRIEVAPGTFSDWIRWLPLAPPGTGVFDAGKDKTVPTEPDQAVAAVAALDVHAEDSSDILLRLHAEWRYSKGSRDVKYLTNASRVMTLDKWLQGDRIIQRNGDWRWMPSAPPTAEYHYSDLRDFLDAFYPWSDPRALAMQGRVLGPNDVVPGDYFVHAGKDPTLVVVLDVAMNAQGEPAMLLAHVAAPRQSMYVMRASAESAWFMPRPTHDITAPGLKPFVWKEHHRLPKAMLETAK